jgi:DNA polymerase (family 10)
MGAKKEALILKALDERKRFAGRHLLPDTHDAAAALVSYLRERAPAAAIDPVGSLRRGCDTCGDLDLLASGAPASLMNDFVEYRLVERVLGHGDTKSSVLIQGGFQADLRLVAADSRGAALQYFTGSKAHNIALRDRAIGQGFKLNEYGLFRVADEVRVAGEREEEIYAALGLDWVAPELREMRGELDAAGSHTLPRLIDLADLRGDLHMHSTETDGKDDVRTMAGAAREAGLEYIAITDHTQSLAMANGLDERRALDHAARIRAIDAEGLGIRLLAGAECDIKPDGSLDLADDCLAALDLVIVSVHSAFTQDRQQMTDRLLRAIEHPHVDILGHATGRRILKRPAYAVDMEAVVDAAARHGVAIEINCQVDRLDVNDVHAKLAHDRGAGIVISSDGHSRHAFGRLRWGVMVARRAWLQPADVLNTRPFDQFRSGLRRHRGQP